MTERKAVITSILALLCLGNLSPASAQHEDKFSFVVMGCAHVGIYEPSEYENAIQKIREIHPDFVVFLGGMVDPFHDEKSVKRLWQEFDDITCKVGIPVYNVPSNCQLTPLELSVEKYRQMEQCFIERYKKRFGSFEYKNNLFILLDSEYLLSGVKNSLNEKKQTDFLKQALNDTSKYNNVFLFLNRAFWLEGEEKRNQWFQKIHPLIKNKVRFVFAANMHCLNISNVDNITYLNSGSPPRYLSAFHHFLIINVINRSSSIKVYPLDPMPIENFKTVPQNNKKNNTPVTFRLTLQDWCALPERKVMLPIETIIQALKIKPGMTIADIGAGIGLFTFPIADKLNNTGKIFATDIDNDVIEYMKNKKETKPVYKNVFPVLVERKSLDKFYTRHKFDIIFLCDTYSSLSNPEEYFRNLRPSLKKNTGRLYIIQPRNTPDFSEFEFEDFTITLNILAEKEKDFPILARLPKELKDFIKNRKDETVPSEIKAAFIQALNQMLLDRNLYTDLLNYYSNLEKISEQDLLDKTLLMAIYPEYRKLVKWLVVNLSDDGIFNPAVQNIPERDKRDLRYLNRTLITGILQSKKLDYIQGTTDIFLGKNSIIATLHTAGYQFIREYKFLPCHRFLEFKAK